MPFTSHDMPLTSVADGKSCDLHSCDGRPSPGADSGDHVAGRSGAAVLCRASRPTATVSWRGVAWRCSPTGQDMPLVFGERARCVGAGHRA
ncbi:hypothetical protein C1N91_06335 [Curtobacterium sp. SGAir0471]|nr:hypothetical protein C1N91_06335 [Curtobacterium sp. SGAir0471]